MIRWGWVEAFLGALVGRGLGWVVCIFPYIFVVFIDRSLFVSMFFCGILFIWKYFWDRGSGGVLSMREWRMGCFVF